MESVRKLMCITVAAVRPFDSKFKFADRKNLQEIIQALSFLRLSTVSKSKQPEYARMACIRLA